MTDNITLPRATVQQALEKVADALPAYIDGVAAREYLAVIHKALEQQAEPDEAQQAMHDLLTTGTSVLLGGKRIDPAGMYKQAEPVGEVDAIGLNETDFHVTFMRPMPLGTKLYAAPPQRKPLTINEVEQILAQHDYEIHGDRARYIVRMTEEAHGIKEGT